MRIRITAITAFLMLSITGCGTTHHFLPPRPLEKREWMLSVTWHYDFGRLTPPTIMPDVNAYIGIGKEYNFGFGAQAPFFISHLSVARYYEAGENNRWAFFSHINQIFGANNNPYLELGGAYIDDRGSFDQMLEFGLGYGHGNTTALLLLLDRNINGIEIIKNCRFMPFIKYAAVGSDVGFSWSHYFGISKTAMSIYKDVNLYRNDTLYVIPADQIDSILTDLNSPHQYAYTCEQLLKIYLQDGDSVVFCGNPIPICGHAVTPFRELQFWMRNGCRVYRDSSGRFTAMNSDSLFVAWERSDTLVIRNFHPEVIEQIDNINSLIDDNSVGFGIITYQKPDD